MIDVKQFRSELGSHFQIEGPYVHVDYKDYPELMTREEAINVFNQESEANGVKPLVSPIGYMPLEDNVYDALKDYYAEAFENQLDLVEQDQAFGSPYALRSVLDDLDKKVRRDSSKLVPDDMKYHELRFVGMNDDIEQAMEQFARTRVQWTTSWSIRRSVTEQTLEKLQERLINQGLNLKSLISQEMQEAKQENSEIYAEINGHGLESALESLESDSLMR